MHPLDPNHRKPTRDDGCDDFQALKAKGLVRDKTGRVIDIHNPHLEWSAFQRDSLYQAYCEMVKASPKPSERYISDWVAAHAKELGMSTARAKNIIDQGNGSWNSPNSRWWRGVSL